MPKSVAHLVGVAVAAEASSLVYTTGGWLRHDLFSEQWAHVVTDDHAGEQWSNVVTDDHVGIRSGPPRGPVWVSRPRRGFADSMTNDVAGGRTVINGRRAQSRVRAWECSDRLGVAYRTGGMSRGLITVHSLPVMRQCLSLPALRGIRRAPRSFAISMDISSSLCGAVIGIRRSHGNLLRFDYHHRITISSYDTHVAD